MFGLGEDKPGNSGARNRSRIQGLLAAPDLNARIDAAWAELSQDFDRAYAAMPVKFMERAELSFHGHVKLLAYLCIDTAGLQGDIVEIGVWKGKSLGLMRRFAPAPTKVVGIDPCAIAGQWEELSYFRERLFPSCMLVRDFSQLAIAATLDITRRLRLLHIDGDHSRQGVWMDFLIYERFLVPGGILVFDDYADSEFSPEVGPAVDRMRELGLFGDYEIVGSLPPFDNSYVLVKLFRP